MRLDARPGETYSRTQIVRMAPGFDPVTRTLDVELHLDNPEGKLRPGMYGRAALQVALHPQTLVLPEAAILGKSGSVTDDERVRASRRREPPLRPPMPPLASRASCTWSMPRTASASARSAWATTAARGMRSALA